MPRAEQLEDLSFDDDFDLDTEPNDFEVFADKKPVLIQMGQVGIDDLDIQLEASDDLPDTEPGLIIHDQSEYPQDDIAENQDITCDGESDSEEPDDSADSAAEDPETAEHDYDKEDSDPRRGKTIRYYLGEKGDLALLTADQECQLGKRVQCGRTANKQLEKHQKGLIELTEQEYIALQDIIADSKEARKTFIEHNLKLVVYVAKKYSTKRMSIMDLVQEGSIGLMTAVEKFDPERGLKFSTYATWWIRQAITRAIMDKDKIIRLPVNVGELEHKIQRTRRELVMRLGREPKLQEIANKCDETLATVKSLTRALYVQPKSLDDTIKTANDNDHTKSYITTVASPDNEFDTDGYTEDLKSQEDCDFIESVVRRTNLTKRELLVISLRFGVYFAELQGVLEQANGNLIEYDELFRQVLLEDKQHFTLEQTGEFFNITRERVRQIHNKAIEKMLIVAKKLQQSQSVC